MMTNHHVFVYGTLKQGEPNNHWLTDPQNGVANFVGEAVTVNKYPLVIASRYNIPFLLAAPNCGQQVEGEVWCVNDAMLDQLDVLECHPKYYERKLQMVIMNGIGTAVECWIYLLHDYKPAMLDLPFLFSYKSKGPHGLEYVARYLRGDDNSPNGYWIDIKLATEADC